ncbi:hypothetical protein DITRI_Ditri18aG0106900 [Diplodiscus trichospermus]
MSFREDNEESRDLKKPFLHTGSWYRMSSRQSSIMGSSAQVLRDGSISVVFCVLIVALVLSNLASPHYWNNAGLSVGTVYKLQSACNFRNATMNNIDTWPILNTSISSMAGKNGNDGRF